jgi:FkbM family methyltransferase
VQRAARCIAFEPDPVAFAALTRNVAANADAPWADRLTIHDCAINKDGASFTLGGSAEGADSMSSGLFPDSASQWTVRAMRLPDVLAAHRAPGQMTFVKIDIEGGEYDLLPALRDVLADPLVTAFISFHPQLIRRALAAAHPEDAAAQAFLDLHLAVIDSLPWTRTIATQEGAPLQRAALENLLRRKGRFPRELLVCDL